MDTWQPNGMVDMSDIYIQSFIRALLVEGKPKYEKSGLRRETDSHWNLILPQIKFSKVVSIDSLKLQNGGGGSIYTAAQNISLCFISTSCQPASYYIMSRKASHVAHVMLSVSVL